MTRLTRSLAIPAAVLFTVIALVFSPIAAQAATASRGVSPNDYTGPVVNAHLDYDGTTLTVGTQSVSARRIEIEATGDWVMVATNRTFGIAISGPSGVPCPDLQGARWELWSEAINSHLLDHA